MTASNFNAALAFVWAPGRDSPRDGYHKSAGDPGGGTFGGVIEATWDNAVRTGIVHGLLANATTDQLGAVLKVKFWQPACDDLPPGLDLLLFNGRMLSGHFPWLFQQCLGFIGSEDVDGWIGPDSLRVARSREPETFIDAVCGVHAAYLSGLDGWARFGNGWTTRIRAVQIAARAMADGAPIA